MGRRLKHYKPQLAEELVDFYREQLYRELSHMFKWKNLPSTVPQDYLERSLVRHGNVLFYEHPDIGLDVLQAEVIGYNRHNQPTHARATVMTTNNEISQPIERVIKRLTDSSRAVEEFNPKTDGVLIRNREDGASMKDIVDHYAYRLALAQQAFDTSLLWANVPYIFQVSSDDVKLSIEKLFHDIFTGKPFVIVDKYLLADNKDRAGVPGVPYIGRELLDTINELMMKFRQAVGIETAGVDKAERVGKYEVDINKQHTKTVLQIMLEQRQIACENINAFFNLDVSVSVVGVGNNSYHHNEDLEELGEGDEYGTGDGGTEEFIED